MEVIELNKKAKEQVIQLARIRFYFNEKNIYNPGLSKKKIWYVANQLEQTMSIIERLLAELNIDWRNYSGLKSRYGKFIFWLPDSPIPW